MTERLFYCFCYSLSLLPWWMLYGISSVLAWVANTFRLYRYKVVLHNLALAFPQKTEKERLAIAREYYRLLADSVVETIKLMTVSDRSLRRKVEFSGWEQLRAQVEAHQSVELYLGHYGNWELVPTITWVIPPEFICAQIYKPMHNALGHSVFERIRNRFGALNINQEKAFWQLMRLHKEGRLTITGVIADQRPNGHFTNWTTFLGLPTAYVAGAEEIGRRIGCAYYYLEVERISRRRTRFVLKPLVPAADEPKYPVTVGFYRMLQATIERDPAPWLWTHKRWAGQA